MNKLKTNYQRNGYQYVLLDRNDHAAIFVQMDGDRIVAYEVGWIKSDKGGQIGDRVIEPGERFWGNDDFGSIAWSITEKERALDRFNELKS